MSYVLLEVFLGASDALPIAKEGGEDAEARARTVKSETCRTFGDVLVDRTS